MSQIFVWISFQLVLMTLVGGSPLSPINDNTQTTTPQPNCGDVKCAENEECIQIYTTCAKAPCGPRFNSYCIKKQDDESSSDITTQPPPPTCDEITCAEDEECVHYTINCFMPPCWPPYEDKCVKKQKYTCGYVNCSDPCVTERVCDDAGSCSMNSVCPGYSK